MTFPRRRTGAAAAVVGPPFVALRDPGSVPTRRAGRNRRCHPHPTPRSGQPGDQTATVSGRPVPVLDVGEIGLLPEGGFWAAAVVMVTGAARAAVTLAAGDFLVVCGVGVMVAATPAPTRS